MSHDSRLRVRRLPVIASRVRALPGRIEHAVLERLLDPGIELERHGTAYGGWIIPAASLDTESVVYSGGIGEDASFDLAVIEQYGCKVWAFDPTPRAAEYAATLDEPRFVFVPVGLWSEDSVQQFHAPPQVGWVSHSIANLHDTLPSFSAECRTLESLMGELGHDHIDLLKLDIEGAEYPVLRQLLAGGVRPRTVCVELHAAGGLNRGRLLLALRRAGYIAVAAEGWNVTLHRAWSSL